MILSRSALKISNAFKVFLSLESYILVRIALKTEEQKVCLIFKLLALNKRSYTYFMRISIALLPFFAFFLFLTNLTNTTAKAAWSARELQHLESFADKTSPFAFNAPSSDVFKTTVYPIAWIRIKGLFGVYETYKSTSHAFSAPTLARQPFIYDEINTDPQKPWVVFVPGIFSFIRSHYVKYNATLIAQQGYNVAYMANSFSEDYLLSQPFFYPGEVSKEAAVGCAHIEHLKKEKGIDKVTIVGISYGGLLATAIATQCKNSVTRVISLNPPIELQASFEQVQHWVKDMKKDPEIFQEMMTTDETWLYLKSWWSSKYTAQLFFTRFFIEWFGHAIFALPLNDPIRKSLIPSHVQSKYSPEFHQWLLDFDLDLMFKQFLNLISQKQQELPTSQLQFWLHQLQEAKIDVSVATSIDDPINSMASWKKLEKQFNPSIVYGLPSGGHLGVSDSYWYEEFFKVFLTPSEKTVACKVCN